MKLFRCVGNSGAQTSASENIYKMLYKQPNNNIIKHCTAATITV